MTTISPEVELDVEETLSPGAIETEATVPVMPLVKLAPDSACSASTRLAWAVSIEAWSRANCSDVAFVVDLVVDPPCPPEPDDADGLVVAAVELVVDGLEPVRAVVPVELVPELDCRPAVKADSSWATFLMSAATVDCAEVAAASASAQVVSVGEVAGGAVVGSVPGAGGEAALTADEGVVVVVVVVVVVASHSTVAWARLVPAAEESLSSWVWSATSAAWSFWICWLVLGEGAPVGDVVVVVVTVACFDDAVVVDSVSLASADTNVALAAAKVALALINDAHRGAGSRVATVCPADTLEPTATLTVLTAPETLKFKLD
jgi:hypothetical protein